MQNDSVAILGHFGEKRNLLNGQTIKTSNLVEGLTKYGNLEVCKIDSHGWTKHPWLLLKQIRVAFMTCDAIIMLPAQNGVRVFAPLLIYYKKKYGKKVFYDVIGGWLPAFLRSKHYLQNVLKSFDGIWTETATMKSELDQMGFKNTTVIPNFKELRPLKTDELVYPAGTPFRLCTFSRVMKEKGIESAARAVKNVNERLGFIAYSLDIYGQIEAGSEDWFESIRKEFPHYVLYKGCVAADKSVEVLKDYFALLFPTHFFTEGIPGTIIDAYSAGVPVISARWESFSDVVEEGRTGIGYEFDNMRELENVLLSVTYNPQKLLGMKKSCLEQINHYVPETVIKEIIKIINTPY